MALMISTNEKNDEHNVYIHITHRHQHIFVLELNAPMIFLHKLFSVFSLGVFKFALLRWQYHPFKILIVLSLYRTRNIQILNGNSFTVDGNFFHAHSSFHSQCVCGKKIENKNSGKSHFYLPISSLEISWSLLYFLNGLASNDIGLCYWYAQIPFVHLYLLLWHAD